jgi:hypothetical protein
MTRRTITKKLLDTAKRITERGDSDQAERVYRKAVDVARMEAGANSGLVGLALLDLRTFYEDQGKDVEAGAVWDQVRDLLMCHYPELVDTSRN